MKYHIEGEISRLTLTLKRGRRDVTIRLKPAPEYIRRDGDVEKVFAVSDNVNIPVRYVPKADFEKWNIKMPDWRRLFDLLQSCKTHRNRIRLEFESGNVGNGKLKIENIVSVSAV